MIENLTDQQLNTELENESKKNRRLEYLYGYSGPDRVVKVEEAKRLEDAKPKPIALKCGFSPLEHLTQGFHPGEVIVISGLTGEGKTTLLQSFTYEFVSRGIVPMWFSYEVGIRDMLARFGTKIPEFVLPLENVPSKLSWLEERIWEGVAKFGINVIFIDHLHYLLSMDDLAKARSTSLVIGQMMRDLKRIAIATNTVIFVVSHTTKVKADQEPCISDLRDSSFTAQEADMVFMVWRVEEGGKALDEGRLKVEKNRRTGRKGTIKLYFRDGRFYENEDGML